MILREMAALQQFGVAARRERRPVVFTDGCFDLFHYGHLTFLRRAKYLLEDAVLVVGVNSDDVIGSVKGEDRPLVPHEERMAVVDAIRYVDIVTPVWFVEPEEVVRTLMPDAYAKVEEYQGKIRLDWFKGRIAYIPRTQGISTSILSKKLGR